MFRSIKQKFRIIAVLEELDDVSKMLKEYLDEYGYKTNILSKLEINIQEEIVILHIDPNIPVNLKNYQIETLVVNLKNPLLYKKDIIKLSKQVEKNGAIVGDQYILEKIEKNLPKNILVSMVDYSSQDANKPIQGYPLVAFYAQSLTRSQYQYSDKGLEADKTWKITNKYAYKLESLLFATLNSSGLVT